jgi:hypothetical protein
MAKAITLIRRCLLLLILCGVATVSTAQIPSIQSDQLDTIPVVLPEILYTQNTDADQENLILAEGIVEEFRIPKDLAILIVTLAEKYAYKIFPTKQDILSIIEIESSFKSSSTHKGCVGLMMINSRFNKSKLRDPETNIKIGAAMLNEHYLLLGNIRSAVLAYNSKYYKKYKEANY